MNTATILNIKTDKKLKANAQAVAKELGIPLGTVVNSLIKQFVREKTVTLSVDTYEVNSATRKAIEEARKEYKEGKTLGPFSTAEEMIASLNS